MGIAIGIDLGMKRTGIAVTDELKLIASPYDTVATGNLTDYLDRMMKRHVVDTIVIGEPRHLDGTDSTMAKNARILRDALVRRYPGIPVEMEDETLTSKMAADSIRRAGARKKQRRDKHLLDKVSAALILQSWLERQSRQSENREQI